MYVATRDHRSTVSDESGFRGLTEPETVPAFQVGIQRGKSRVCSDLPDVCSILYPDSSTKEDDGEFIHSRCDVCYERSAPTCGKI